VRRVGREWNGQIVSPHWKKTPAFGAASCLLATNNSGLTAGLNTHRLCLRRCLQAAPEEVREPPEHAGARFRRTPSRARTRLALEVVLAASRAGCRRVDSMGFFLQQFRSPLKNPTFCHSERSEESLFDPSPIPRRDSSAKSAPQNDKKMLIPQPVNDSGGWVANRGSPRRTVLRTRRSTVASQRASWLRGVGRHPLPTMRPFDARARKI